MHLYLSQSCWGKVQLAEAEPTLDWVLGPFGHVCGIKLMMQVMDRDFASPDLSRISFSRHTLDTSHVFSS